MMNKKLLSVAVGMSLSLTATVSTALPVKANLAFTAGVPAVTACGFGTLNPVDNLCYFGTTPTNTELTDMTGSYFAMDTVVTNALFEINEKNAMTPLGAGVALGELISFVDEPWVFGGPLGQHYVTGTTGGTGLQILTSNTINMQGWTVFYNGGDIDMGTGVDSADARAVSNGGTLPDGNTAILSCNDADACNAGSTYSLDYVAVVPTGGFAGIAYTVHLEGTVSDLNQAPVASPITGLVTQLNTNILVDVVASASDAADSTGDDGIDATSVSTTMAAVGGTVSAINGTTGVMTFTPTAGFTGAASFEYTVTDGLGKISNVATVSITVNDPPVAADFNAGTTDKNIDLAGIDVVANATDSDGTPVATTVLVSASANGGTTSANPTTGVVTYTPLNNYTGADSFTYTIEDNDGGVSNSGTVSLVVNNPPVAVPDGTFVAQIITPLAITVLANDTDADGNGTIDATSVIAGNGAKGTTSVNGTTGVVTYTPGAAQTGLDSFTYTVKDTTGSISNSATVNLRINIAPVAVDDAIGTAQDAAVDVPVPGNDGDADGSLDLTSVNVTSPTNGTAVANATTGVVTFTPTAGYSGPASFTYTIDDNDGATSNLATANINVVVGNIPPNAGSFAQLTNKNTAVAVDVVANSTDSDGTVDPTTVNVTANTNGIAVANATTGVVTFTPTAGYTGAASFTYTVDDNQAATSGVGTVSITVNDPPVAVNDVASTDVNVAADINVLINDTDSDDSVDPTTVNITGNTNGTAVANAGTGVVTFTPTASYTGSASFTYTVDDTRGFTSNVATVTVTVNAAPTAVDDVGASNKGVAAVIDVLANDSDSDGTLDATSVIASNGTNGSTAVNATTGAVTYTPVSTFSGADSFTYTVKDNNGLISNTATVVVSVNDAPVALDDAASVNSGSSVAITVTANDTDSDSTLNLTTVSASQGANGTTTVNATTGVVTYTPGASFAGSDSFTYTVNDDKGAVSNSATVTISVNDLPVAVNDASSVNRNSEVVIDVLINDTDSDGTINVTSVVASNGIDGTTTVDAVTGAVTYTPNAGFIGADTFTYTVNDDLGATSNSATVDITVNNNLPVAVNDTASLDLNAASNISLDVTANDTDADGNLERTTVTISAAAVSGTTSINPLNGVITYTPNAGVFGLHEFNYTIEDNNAGVSNAAKVSINVPDPSALGGGLPNDALLQFNLLTTNLSAPLDGDGSWFSMPGLGFLPIESFNGVQLGIDQPASGSHGLAPDGTERKNIDEPWNFSSNTGMHQTTTKPTILSDDGLGNVTLDFSGWNVTWNGIPSIPMNSAAHSGGVDGVAAMTCVVDCTIGDTYIINYYATVPDGDPSGFGGVQYTLHLEGTIQQGSIPTTAPVARDDAAAVAPLGTVVIDLTDNVFDSFGNLHTNIDFSTLTTNYPGSATLVDNGNGTLSYTAGSANTTDSFSFRVSDNIGESTNTATVNITVNSSNLPPVASSFAVQVVADTATIIDVLTSVSDDGIIDVATVSASQSVNGNGTTTVDTLGVVTYTPNTGFTGSDSFSYTVKDDTGAASNLAYVSVFVNGAVSATDDLVSVDRNASVEIDVTLNDADTDGTLDLLSIVIVANPLAGGIALDPTTGLITYTPGVDYLGTDLFVYTINDNAGGTSNEATVDINVINAVPIALDDGGSLNTSVDLSVVIDVVANDSDADGTVAPSTVVVATAPANGTTTVNAATGAITYTPNFGYVGAEPFTYTVSDNDGGVSNEANVVVTVSAGISIMPATSILTVVPATITGATIFDTPAIGAGSWFNMEVKPGEKTHVSIAGFKQLQIGTSQLGSADAPNIDSVWSFFGNPGVHQTTSPVNILTDNGVGNVTLDLSGWNVSWNAIPSIPINSRAHSGGVDGVAEVTCQAGIDGIADCSEGDSYILEYFATVPDKDPSGFGNVQYTLHLEGQVLLEQPCIGGCPIDPTTVAYDVVETLAMDDASNVVTIEPGATAQSVGNLTGFGLTPGETGITDPSLNPDNGQQCIGGCLDFVATGLTSGGYLDLVVYLSEVVPEGASFRKLINGVWQNFDDTQGDLIGSAAAVGNACQGPLGSFEIGLRTGNQCLFLRITDGGPNDADGVANGTIVDPSGVLLAGSPNTPSGSSSGCSISSTNVEITERADWLLVAGFIVWFGLMSYRRKKAMT